MEVITMEKNEDRIFDVWIPGKILRQDDEKTLLLIQLSRKKGLISYQILIRLGSLWKKKIGKPGVFRTAGGLGPGGNPGPE
jgi:hypothetical protein